MHAPAPARRQKSVNGDSEFSIALEVLHEVLGPALIAIIVGRDVPTIERWRADGDGPADTRERRRIVDTLRTVDVLLRVESRAMTRAWFMGMNPDLGDANPAELLAENHTRDVLATARNHPEGS